MAFVELLQEKLGEHTPNEIEELILDGLFTVDDSLSEEQKKGLEQYSSLIHLCMNGFGFKSLKNFPNLPNLQILEISNNKINGSDLAVLGKLYPKLYKIKLGGNEIATLDTLKGLSSLKELKKVEVEGCPFVSNNENYKKELFDMIDTLEVVDGENKEGKPVESTVYDDEGEEEDDDDIDDEEFEDDDDDDAEEFEEEEDDEDDDDDDEDEKPAKKTKKH